MCATRSRSRCGEFFPLITAFSARAHAGVNQQTSQLPEDDRYSVSLKQYLAEIDVCMGGRVAEELSMSRNKLSVCVFSDTPTQYTAPPT